MQSLAGVSVLVMLLANLALGETGPASGNGPASESRQAAEQALWNFANGGSREEFLKALKALAAEPGLAGWYNQTLEDLSLPDKPPPGYEKKPEDRTADERYRAWIYDLRDMKGDNLPEFQGVATPAERLVAAGYPAMDLLLEAADDHTPTRMHPFRISLAGPSLLSRGDLVCQIIGRITAIRGAVSGQTGGSPDALRRWWAGARGQSQVAGLRLWMRGNLDSGYNATLALIEGSDEDIRMLRAMQTGNLNQYGNQVSEALAQLDRRCLVHTSMERFWTLNTTRFDLSYVTRYGDQRVYAEIAHRIEQGTESALWTQDLNSYLNKGEDWAIPAHVAIVLHNAGDTGSISMQAANHALDQLTRLTGQDFGYVAGGSSSTPQPAAYQKLKDWWQNGGKEAMAAKIAQPRPSPTEGTDLLDTDDIILKRVADISGTNPLQMRPAIRVLPRSYSSEVQRALLQRIAAELLAKERQTILSKFASAAVWQGPPLAALLENDPDETVRLAVAELLGQTLGKSTIDWTLRLQPRVESLTIIRRVAADTRATPATRKAAAKLLLQWNSFEEREVLGQLRNDPVFKDEPLLQVLDQLQTPRAP